MCHPNGVPCIFVHCIMCMCMCLAGRRLPQRHSLRRGVPSQVRRSRWRVVRSSCARYCYRPLHPRAASPLRLPRPAPPRLASPRLAPLRPASPRLASPRPASLNPNTHARRVAQQAVPNPNPNPTPNQAVPLWRVSTAAAAHTVHAHRCAAYALHTVRGCHRRAVAELDAHSPMQMLCMYTACIVHCMCTARTLHRRAVRHVPARPRPGSVRPLGLRAERRGRARVRVALRHSDGALRAPPRSGATACLLEPVRPPAARRRIAPPHRAARIHIHTHIAPPPTTTLRRNPRLFFLPPPAPIPTPGATATQ